MDTPQEVEVWYILPTVRKQFVISFKKHKLKQKEIASLMGLTEPAVSQYLKNKRGNEIRLNKDILSEIDVSAERSIRTGRYQHEFQQIIQKVKLSGFLCNVCHTRIKTPENCDICHG
jgi:predicted transcriptional regulator